MALDEMVAETFANQSAPGNAGQMPAFSPEFTLTIGAFAHWAGAPGVPERRRWQTDMTGAMGYESISIRTILRSVLS